MCVYGTLHCTVSFYLFDELFQFQTNLFGYSAHHGLYNQFISFRYLEKERKKGFRDSRSDCKQKITQHQIKKLNDGPHSKFSARIIFFFNLQVQDF